MIKQLFYWYLANQNELVKEYDGKVLVIVNNEVTGAFNSNEEALSFAQSHFKAGEFIIQRCSEGNKDYTQTFHSRVAFV